MRFFGRWKAVSVICGPTDTFQDWVHPSVQLGGEGGGGQAGGVDHFQFERFHWQGADLYIVIANEIDAAQPLVQVQHTAKRRGKFFRVQRWLEFKRQR